MPKVDDVYRAALKQAAQHEIEGSDVRYLLMVAEGFSSPADVIYYRDREMKNPDLFDKWMKERIEGRPVQYITHYASFLLHNLYVDERVLIPRPETEFLVSEITERISDYFDPRNLLMVADIGTGSGAIARALSTFFPKWIIFASDISKGALEVARKNLEGTHVELLEGDALEPFIKKGLKLDILVANPPYVLSKEEAEPIVRDNEPDKALYFQESNNVYEKIFKDIHKVKKGPMFLAFEIGPGLEDMLISCMDKYLGKHTYEIVKDNLGLSRYLFVDLE